LSHYKADRELKNTSVHTSQGVLAIGVDDRTFLCSEGSDVFVNTVQVFKPQISKTISDLFTSHPEAMVRTDYLQ
jgi:hypothetical protein